MIDVHTHVFHPKIAAKVLDQLRGHYDITPVGSGLAEDLIKRMDRAGVAMAVVHTAATSPDQVIPANNWALSLKSAYPRLIPFGTVHPGFHGWPSELDRLEQAGVIGIKLHPDFQGFSLDDASLHPILKELRGRFLVMVHVGDRLPPDKNPSSPEKLARLLERFPGLTVIAAHFGGYLHWDQVPEHLAGKDLYIDTSSTLAFASDAQIESIINKHPLDRFLFGSDYPLFDPSDELEALGRRCAMAEKDLKCLAGNAARLLGISKS
ncbi:MAG: amidohydrolase [Deltaproteobacteria bacterium]|nr:amidohydrolase [Deltaproteobacteria bacterium]